MGSNDEEEEEEEEEEDEEKEGCVCASYRGRFAVFCCVSPRPSPGSGAELALVAVTKATWGPDRLQHRRNRSRSANRVKRS